MSGRRRSTAVFPLPSEATPAAGPRPRRLPPYVAWACAGTVLALGLLLLDVRASGQGIIRPIRPGTLGPSAVVVARDFPASVLPDEVGVDGQQFYAIARDPWHPNDVAPSLDRPRYRYQRPLLPVLAWALHPSGGGPGLVVALVVVNLAGLLVGGLALGALGRRLKGPPWLALLYPVLPGALWALFDSVADGLAVSLALLTIVAVLGGRNRLAWLAAVAAVLTKETTILVPLALVIARRRRSDLPVLLAPAVVLAAWTLAVHVLVPAGGVQPELPVLPLTGFVDAFRTRWLHGRELIGMAATLSATVAGVVVLARRRGPLELRWVIALQLALLSICSSAVLGDDFGGTRSTLLLLAAACACLLTSPARAPAVA